MIIAEVVQFLPSDFASSVLEQMRPLLTTLVVQMLGLWAGLQIVKVGTNQMFQILQALDDQADWERVYNSTKATRNESQMRDLRDEFWGKGNKGVTRSKRARKNKFFVDE